MSVEVSGILGFIWLVITIWAIVKIAQSSSSTGAKALWVILILLLPVVGVIAWFFIGPKG